MEEYNIGNLEKYRSKKLSEWFEIKEKLISLLEKEFFRYLVGGASVTLLNAGVYTLLLLCGMQFYWANLVALVLAKGYGYVVNKYFVYKTSGLELRETLKEAGKYFFYRGITGVIDYVLLFVFVHYLGWHPLFMKYAVMVIVIVLNYLFSKYFVFKKTKTP